MEREVKGGVVAGVVLEILQENPVCVCVLTESAVDLQVSPGTADVCLADTHQHN